MTGTLRVRLACAVIATLIALVGSATQSIAADPPDQTLDFPAGLVCDFPLHIDIWNNPNQVVREFKDKNGNVVRMLTAGKGSTLVFTNLDNGKSLSLKPNGAVQHIALNPDGSQTLVVTGHNVLFLFPTDVPPGPSTTLHVGRVVFTADSSGNFTVLEISGETTDICAALAN
jgi:hypothetical protein